MKDGRVRGPSIRTFAQRAGRVALIITAVLLISLLVLFGVLLFISPGTPKPFLGDGGKPLIGSISEKIKVNIGGVEQGMFIKGKNARNPVLLYLHGGMPDYFLTEDYPTGLDEYFTMDYMLGRFRDDGNTKRVQQLEAAPVGNTVPLPDTYLKVRDGAMHELGVGTTHDMKSIATGLLLRALLNREYTLNEKTNMWRGKIFSDSRLWNTELSTDLTKKVARLEIPVYFFHGAYDYTVSYPLARSHYKQLVAPVKGFYTFKHSAHSPLFEEPEKMREIMRADVLTGSKGFADPEREISARLSYAKRSHKA